MAEHTKFGPMAVEHDLTPKTDSKVAETKEMCAEKVKKVTHDRDGSHKGTVPNDIESSYECKVVGAANVSMLTGEASINYPAGVSDGTQQLRASVTNLGVQHETKSASSVTATVNPGLNDPCQAERVLQTLTYRIETALDRIEASKLTIISAGTHLGDKTVPKLVFMISCLPAHLKAPNAAEIAAGAEPVEQRELPVEIRSEIFKYMFETEEPLCLDSPRTLLRLSTAGMLKLLKRADQPFKVEDDNEEFDVHHLLARQFKHRKNIESFLPIFSTCKEINVEAGKVLYGINKFTFLDIEGVKDILDNLSGRICRQIHKLLIKFEAGAEGYRKLMNAIRGIHRNCANVRTLELRGVVMEAISRLGQNDDDEFEKMKTNLKDNHVIPLSTQNLKVEDGYSYLEHTARMPSGIIKYKLLPPKATVLMTGHTKFFIKPYVQHFEIHNAYVAARELIEIQRTRVRREKAAAEKMAADQEIANTVKKEAEEKRKADIDLAVGAGKKHMADDLEEKADAGKKRKVDDLEKADAGKKRKVDDLEKADAGKKRKVGDLEEKSGAGKKRKVDDLEE